VTERGERREREGRAVPSGHVRTFEQIDAADRLVHRYLHANRGYLSLFGGKQPEDGLGVPLHPLFSYSAIHPDASDSDELKYQAQLHFQCCALLTAFTFSVLCVDEASAPAKIAHGTRHGPFGRLLLGKAVHDESSSTAAGVVLDQVRVSLTFLAYTVFLLSTIRFFHVDYIGLSSAAAQRYFRAFNRVGELRTVPCGTRDVASCDAPLRWDS
jgi:hypothetical protein